MASINDKVTSAAPRWSGKIGSSGVPSASATTIPLDSVTNLTDGEVYYFTINRVDASGNRNSLSDMEVVKGQLSGTNLINCVRGVEGTAQAWSAGTVAEILFTAAQWNDLKSWADAEHNADGTHGDVTLANSTDFTTEHNPDGTHKNVTAISVTTTGDVTAGGSVKTDTISEKTSGAGITISHATKPAYQSVTYASTITFDLSKANYFMVTLSGNPTLAVSNATVGQHFIVRLKQDGTGSRTVTWWSGISWVDGTAPDLTTTANKADVFGFTVTGSGAYDGFIVGQNI